MNAGVGEAAELVFREGKSERGLGRSDDRQRVRFKGQDGDGGTRPSGECRGLFEQSQMREMDSVEISDAEHRVQQRGIDSFESVNGFHYIVPFVRPQGANWSVSG